MKKLLIYTFALVLMSAALTGYSIMRSQNVGMVTGGVMGGMAGHTLTGGSTVGTIAGAVGGAFVGSEVGKSLDKKLRLVISKNIEWNFKLLKKPLEKRFFY